LADNKNLKVVRATPIHRLGAADVGQNKGIVWTVADIRRITTVSANQPMVIKRNVSADSCYAETS
jgi:hypothetical protein